MKCSNCEQDIKMNGIYYRAGKNNTAYCSKDCSYEAYAGFYSKRKVDQTMKQVTRTK